MGLFDHFPYTNFHELNLDWMLNALRELEHTINDFVAINALKYADPIQWNITTQYEKNTIVIDPQTGTAYISVQPVPAGVSLTNTDYWTVVFDLSTFVVKAAKNLAVKYENETTTTATFNSNIGDWLVWSDTLYIALTNITAGDSYVIDSNIKHFTIEDIVGHLTDLDTTDKTNIVAAINEVVYTFNTLYSNVGDLATLSTTDQSSIVNAINEIVTNIGDLSNLTTTDQSSIVNAINEVNSNITAEITNRENADEALSENILNVEIAGKHIKGNLLLNHFYSTSDYGVAQGGCYVENNYVVQYYPTATPNNGVLKCYDIVNHNEVWSHNLQLYHGNTITYVPETEKLYVTGCKNESDDTLINMIFEIDWNNPSAIQRVITLPDTASCISLVYDQDKELFYGVSYLGTTPGVADMLYIYNKDLTELIDTIQLEDHLSVRYGYSNQGTVFGRNGIAYVLYYEPVMCPTLIGYDITTGKAVSTHNIPYIVNECRSLSEYEWISYDSTTDRVYAGAMSYVGDIQIANYYALNIMELELFKGIEYNPYVPYANTNYQNTAYCKAVYMKHGTFTLAPSWMATTHRMCCFGDAANYSRLNGAIRLIIESASINTAYRPVLNGCKMHISNETGNTFNIAGLNFEYAEIALFNMTFTDGLPWATNFYAQLIVTNSRVYVQGCTFTDYTTGLSGTFNHIFARWGAVLSNAGNIYQGGFGTDVRGRNAIIDGVYVTNG